jgi:hypothetical protein
MVAMRNQPEGGESLDSERELMPENARSLWEGLWRIAQLTQDAADALDSRIED